MQKYFDEIIEHETSIAHLMDDGPLSEKKLYVNSVLSGSPFRPSKLAAHFGAKFDCIKHMRVDIVRPTNINNRMDASSNQFE